MILTICFALELLQLLSLRSFIAAAIGVLLLVQLVTKIPFLSHDLASMRDVEQLAKEQEKNSVMSWKVFMMLLAPWLFIILLRAFRYLLTIKKTVLRHDQ